MDSLCLWGSRGVVGLGGADLMCTHHLTLSINGSVYVYIHFSFFHSLQPAIVAGDISFNIRGW